MGDKTLEAVIKLKDEMSKSLKDIQKTLDNFEDSATDTDKALELLEGATKDAGKAIRDIQQETRATREAINDLGNTTEDMADAMDNMADSVDDGAKAVKGMALQEAGAKMSEFGGKILEVAASMLDLTEATKEYNTLINKLEGASVQYGYDKNAAKQNYNDVYKYLGDDMASVNVVTNLQGMGLSQKELDKTLEASIAVWTAYGDSIPIEGLTESINETAQVGKITGNLADALNWAGISEDAFNERLEKTKTVQERNKMITEALTEAYGKSKKQFDETSGAILDYNDAQRRSMEIQAQIGETLAPVNAAIEGLKASLLESLAPALEKMAEFIQPVIEKISEFVQKNPELATTITMVVGAVGTLCAVLGPLLTIFGIATTVITGPVVLAFLKISAIIAGVIAIGALLIANWDKIKKGAKESFNACKEELQIFKDAFSMVWQGIKNVASTLWGGLKSDFQSFISFISNCWDGLINIVSTVWQGIKNVITVFVDGLKNDFNNFVSFISAGWESIEDVASTVWNAIKTVISTVWEGIKTVAQVAIQFIVNYLSNLLAQAQVVWNTIKSVAQTAFNAIKSTVQTVCNTIKSLWESVKTAVTNAVNGAKDMAINAFNAVKDKVKSITDGISDAWNKVRDTITNNPIVGTVTKVIQSVTGNTDGSHAAGLSRVPFDGYIAELHQGESVLPRREADKWRENKGASGIQIAKIADTVVIREEADIDKITSGIVRKIQQQRIITNG